MKTKLISKRQEREQQLRRDEARVSEITQRASVAASARQAFLRGLEKKQQGAVKEKEVTRPLLGLGEEELRKGVNFRLFFNS